MNMEKQMRSTILTLSGIAALALSTLTPIAARAADSDLNCRMSFSMSGWSAFYKTASGSGVVTCSNGQTMKVKLQSTGGGLTVGKSSIDEGHGEFSGVREISDVVGSYVAGSAHAGAVNASSATVVTKGEVSLALSGKGRGWDIGVDFSKFTIKPAL